MHGFRLIGFSYLFFWSRLFCNIQAWNFQITPHVDKLYSPNNNISSCFNATDKEPVKIEYEEKQVTMKLLNLTDDNPVSFSANFWFSVWTELINISFVRLSFIVYRVFWCWGVQFKHLMRYLETSMLFSVETDLRPQWWRSVDKLYL